MSLGACVPVSLGTCVPVSLGACVPVSDADVGSGPGEICDEGSGKDVADDVDEIEGTLVGEGAEVGGGALVVGCGLG